MSVTARLDRFQQRHPGAGFPLAVFYKYFDDQGNYLAAIITYYALVSLFPLLLLLTTILGFVLKGDPELQKRILNSTLSQFPVIGEQLGTPKGLQGNTVGIIVGIVGSIYGGLGVAQAAQHAMNTAWAVPRNERPNPFRARGRSLLLLGTAGLGILATTVLSALGSSAESFGARLGLDFKLLLTAASVVVNAAIFLLAFRVATARPVSYRDIAPGALLSAVAWQVLQSLGTAYIGHVVKNASALNAVFALILGLIAWIYLSSVLVVLCAEVNVVRAFHLFPRSLLTPFTDAVELTTADEDAYTMKSKAQRLKGFQHVEVSFEPKDPPGDEPRDSHESSHDGEGH
jgi:membrane protein